MRYYLNIYLLINPITRWIMSLILFSYSFLLSFFVIWKNFNRCDLFLHKYFMIVRNIMVIIYMNTMNMNIIIGSYSYYSYIIQILIFVFFMHILSACVRLHAHKLWNNNKKKNNINFWLFNTIENNSPTKLPSNKLNCDGWNMYKYWHTHSHKTLCLSTCVLYINYSFGAKTNHFDSESIQWHRPQKS